MRKIRGLHPLDPCLRASARRARTAGLLFITIALVAVLPIVIATALPFPNASPPHKGEALLQLPAAASRNVSAACLTFRRKSPQMNENGA